jgi:hypothetical protein
MRIQRFAPALVLVASLAGAVSLAHAAGPIIDWDPAYTYEAGATPTNSIPGSEFHLVGTISSFGPPLAFLDASDPTKEFTFYVHGLISQGTTSQGSPSMMFYQTQYSGGTIEIYQDNAPNATFAPNPPNALVPSTFTDGGPPILTGSFTSFLVESNNFTTYDVGNIEGGINWTGGTLYPQLSQGSSQPCPGLFMGGTTWYPGVMFPGYIYRHDGKIDLQCPTPTRSSTWGRLKTLYR